MYLCVVLLFWLMDQRTRYSHEKRIYLGSRFKERAIFMYKGFKFVYYISAGQTSLLQVQWEITLGRVLYVEIAVFCVIPEIRKGNEIDSVE